MITELTEKQIEQMGLTKEKWISKLNKLERMDEKKFVKDVTWFHKFCGLKKPKVIFVKSPLAIQYYCNLMYNNKVGTKVWNEVRNKVWNEVRNKVGNEVGTEVWNEVGTKVWNEVRNKVGNEVGNEVENKVWNEVENEVENKVENNKLLVYFTNYYNDIGSFGWMSYYDYFINNNIITIPTNLKTLFNKYKSYLSNNQYTMVQGRDFVVVCPLPLRLSRNHLGNMHNLTDYAIEWEDGYKLAYVDGVYIDYELFEKFRTKSLTYQELVSINNIEQRYVMLKYYGTDKLLKESKSILLDTGKNGIKLYSLPGLINNKQLKLLRYNCPSTGREYISFVPYEMEKANSAMAWKHNITEEEYMKLKMEA